MESKNVEGKFEKKLTLSFEKINSQEIIKEALSTIPKKEENTKEINNNLKISEQINKVGAILAGMRNKRLSGLADEGVRGWGDERMRDEKNINKNYEYNTRGIN